MGRTAKVTVSLPRELISLTDQVAREKKTNRSQVVSSCLQELAERYRVKEMTEGYEAMAKEQKQFVAVASEIAHEVLPEWK